MTTLVDANVLSQLGTRLRLVVVPNPSQWAVQRHAGAAWQSFWYCQTRAGLERLLHASNAVGAGIDADGRRLIAALPERIGWAP